MTERRTAIKETRAERRAEFQMRDPTETEANIALLTIQNRIDYCSLCDSYGAIFGRNGEEQNEEFQVWFYGAFGDDAELPHLIENLAPDNIWSHWRTPPPVGKECCYPENLGAVPPGLLQWQIDAINDCGDKDAIIMAGEQQKAKLKERRSG